MGNFDRTARRRTARFPSPGTTVAGTVLSIAESAVPDFVDGRIVGPKFDVNGTVEMQVDVTVQTATGETVIHTREGIAVAIGKTLADLGVDDLSVGDELSVTYVGDEDPEEGDAFPTKVYAASIVPTNPTATKRRKG